MVFVHSPRLMERCELGFVALRTGSAAAAAHQPFPVRSICRQALSGSWCHAVPCMHATLDIGLLQYAIHQALLPRRS